MSQPVTFEACLDGVGEAMDAIGGILCVLVMLAVASPFLLVAGLAWAVRKAIEKAAR